MKLTFAFQKIIASLFILLLIACSSPKKDYLDENDGTKDPPTKVDGENNSNPDLDLIKEGIDLTKEFAEEIRQNQVEKDSVYNANRKQKWVLKLGEAAKDKEYLLEDYEKIKALGEISLFRTNSGKYFMFLEHDGSEFELTELIPTYESKLEGTEIAIETFDLISDCSKKQQLVIVEPAELGKRKNKITLKCYACEK